MDKLSFLEVIAAIAVFVSLLLSVFLLTVKAERKLENRIFTSSLIKKPSLFTVVIHLNTTMLILIYGTLLYY